MTLTLSAQNLGLRFGSVDALKGLDFSISEPGIHGLLGRNGSGKTSLLSLVAGLRKPSLGRIMLDGQDIFENESAMGQIAIIRESGDMESSDTISDTLEFSQWMRPNWDMDRAKSLLDQFGLSVSKKVSTLSRGQRAALASTIGIAARAPLTLFDETYLGMDAPARQLFYDTLLEDFMAHPRMIIVSTHLIEEISKLFERLLIIHEGQFLLNENAETLRGRGITITGAAHHIDPLIAGRDILATRELGPTRSVALLDPAGDLRTSALETGLEVGPIPLQDLFIHLTAKGAGK